MWDFGQSLTSYIPSMAVDDTAVYWVANGETNGQPDDRVMMVIK